MYNIAGINGTAARRIMAWGGGGAAFALHQLSLLLDLVLKLRSVLILYCRLLPRFHF